MIDSEEFKVRLFAGGVEEAAGELVEESVVDLEVRADL